MGVVVGFLSIRLGDLYVALVTLTFGLLMENLVFTLPSFVNQGLGLTLNRPGFATSDRAFAYLCLVAFVIIALFIVNFRRSTTGLALNAARWSEAGARTSGISVVQMKVIAGALAALIAGHRRGSARHWPRRPSSPASSPPSPGVVWLAVLVTIGVRSNAAALIAGLDASSCSPPLAQDYLPTVDVPTCCRCSSVSAPSRRPSTPTACWPSRAGELRRLVLRLLAQASRSRDRGRRPTCRTGHSPDADAVERRPAGRRSTSRDDGAVPRPRRPRTGATSGRRHWRPATSPSASAGSPPLRRDHRGRRRAASPAWSGPTVPASRRCSAVLSGLLAPQRRTGVAAG